MNYIRETVLEGLVVFLLRNSVSDCPFRLMISLAIITGRREIFRKIKHFTNVFNTFKDPYLVGFVNVITNMP